MNVIPPWKSQERNNNNNNSNVSWKTFAISFLVRSFGYLVVCSFMFLWLVSDDTFEPVMGNDLSNYSNVVQERREWRRAFCLWLYNNNLFLIYPVLISREEIIEYGQWWFSGLWSLTLKVINIKLSWVFEGHHFLCCLR